MGCEFHFNARSASDSNSHPTPNDFPSLEALQERLLSFARYYEAIAQPFEWKFTRKDLDSLLQRIDRAHASEHPLLAAA